MKKSVCVIGAGAAGLCALRHFTSRSEFGLVLCFEQSDQIGGTWVYTEQVGLKENGLPVHTSMYRDMRVNGPVQIMDFPDYPFPTQSVTSYTHHSKVLEYLHDYARHFNLLSHIHFGQHLIKVTRDQDCWQVIVRDVATDQKRVHKFDVIILCPGRYSTPKWPQIEGIDEFTGSIIHSHDYRSRESYTGKQVAVIGAGPSGIDMALEVSSVATQVIFINCSAIQFPNLPENVQQIKGAIQKFSSKSMLVKVGEKLIDFEVHAVILATGYALNIDYLEQESCGLRLNADDSLDGIFRHLINIKYHTMALLSICKPTLSFPLYHQQILYFIKTLLKEIPLPSSDEMYQEVLQDLENRKAIGLRPKDRHLLKSIPVMKKYFELLEKDANLEPIKPVVFKVLEEIVKTRNADPVGYKEYNYRLIDGERYEEVALGQQKGG